MPTPSSQLVLETYTDQPARLPDAVRARALAALDGGPILLYALCDLDSSMRLVEEWVVLGRDKLLIVRGQTGSLIVNEIDRFAITAVKESTALSGSSIALEGNSGSAALAILRHTRRQQQAVGNLVFALKQALEKRPFEPSPDQADRAYADAVAHPIREAQASVARNKLTVVWRLLSYLKPYRAKMILGMLAATLMTLVSLAPPWLTGHMIDKVIRPFEDGSLSQEEAMKIAMLTLGALVAVHLLREAFAYFRLRTMALLGEHVAHDLRQHLYSHLHKLSVGYFSSKQTGSIISRVSSDTDRIWDFIAFGVVELSLSFLMLAGLSVVLISTDLELGLVVTLPLPFVLWLIFAHGRGMRQLFLRAWRKWSNMTDVLSDTIPGIRVVKAFDQAAQEKKRFGDRNRSVTGEFFRIHERWTSFWPLLMLVVHGLSIAIWAIAIPRILGPSDSTPLTAGVFVSFLLYLGMIFYPIEVCGQMSRMMNRALSSAHRIFEVLDTEPQVTDAAGAADPGSLQGEIQFEGVSFGYDPVRPVLRNIDFHVRPGEMIGLVGPSGAGKTTIINLIARFYDVTAGRILVDGKDLRELDTGLYRRQLGMVLQDPFLFHGTLLDNIRYGMPDARPADVIASARAANAHDFICRLPHGYDTVVGERGHTLSGGERQRVSIARAILHNPRILILDEATSSVDTETEHKIQEALDRLVSNRTVIAIAHRLSTLKRANRLLVVKEGRIAEQGTHAELLAIEDGVYRKLYSLQQELHEIYAL